MSDEIVDVQAQHVSNLPNESKLENGLNIPDPTFVENVSDETESEIEKRRLEIQNLPEYPKEWQEESSEDSSGFESNQQIPVSATIKQDEVKKLIKKYKRYMRSNIREIRRVENDVES